MGQREDALKALLEAVLEVWRAILLIVRLLEALART